MSNKIRTTVLTIGQCKDHPRIWIEGRYLEQAGFYRGSKINVKFMERQIQISLDKEGEKIISGKKTPIIELNNEKITESFNEEKSVRVIVYVGQIIITSTKQTQRKLLRLQDNSYGAVFSGAGLMDQSAKKSGYNSKWAIELNESYADMWQANHKGTMHNSSIEQIDYSELDQVELLIGGIPCEPFSIARRNQGNEMYEEHQNADLSMFFLMIVEAVNPRCIVLEEVPAYLKSGIGTATVNALKRMGYNVSVKIISGLEYGELTVRKRAVIVATTDDYKFPEESKSERTLGEILLKADDPRCEWFTRETKSWLFEHWDNQKAKGNNFNSQIITEDSTQIQAIKKRYFAQQGDNPVVKHPTLPDTYRWLTLSEVKIIMGLDESYDLGETKTVAGEALGQGVLINVFKKIIDSLKEIKN